MTDFVTLTINEEFLKTFVNLLIFIAFLFVIFVIVDIFLSEIQRAKKIEERAKQRKRDAPYIKEFERLKKEGKRGEASDYIDKYGDYLFNGTYY